MPKITVILEAKAKDRGTRSYLRDMAKLANEYADAANKASAAGRKMVPPSPLAGAMVTPGGGERAGAGGGGRRRRQPRDDSRRVRLEREFDRALSASVRDAKAQARALDKQERAARRAAKNIANLTDAQLQEIEIQHEINRRRRRAARAAAKTQLGPDPTAAAGGRGRGRGMGRGGRAVEFGANLAIAGAEFEQFGAQVETGIRSAFDSFKDYEKSIAEVSTLTDEIPIEKIKEITSGAAQEFGGLPTDQVKAFYSIVSAGATTSAEAQEQLTFANKLAIGGVAEQEEAVLAISKSVANFKSQGVDAAQAADSLFTAVKRGQTTVAEMATALPLVAQAAADSGLSLDQTNAAIAVLSTRFPTAKQGATALRAALSNISKPTKTARKEAKRLGIDFSTAGIEAAGGIEGFLVKLSEADKFDENTLAKLFDSTEARAAVGGLISGMNDYRSVLTDMEAKQGAADTAFQKMSETSAQKAKKLEAQWEMLKIQAGEALVPALTDLAEQLGPIIENVTKWIKDNPNLAATLAKVAIGAAIGGRVIGGLTSAISMVSSITGLAQGGMDAFGGSVTAAGRNASASAGQIGRLGPSIARLGPILAGAGAAIVAFQLVLDAAQKPLAEYEEQIEDVTKQQMNIEFKTPEGKEKSEAELLIERRNRLIQVANAARTMEAEAGGGRALSNLRAGNISEAFGQAYGGVLNRASGTQEEFERQRFQAELDLMRFDQQYGKQIGLAEEQMFQVPVSQGLFGEEGVSGQVVDLLRRQVEATEKVAGNTGNQQWWQGPSMEAGSV